MDFTNKTIGEIVAEDFRTAAIFKKHGIDFCCRGGRTIEEACEKKKVMEQQLIDELSALPSGKGDNVDVSSFIEKLAQAAQSGTPLEPSHFGTVENPIEMMKHDHTIEGDRFAKIAEITQGYTPPADACNTYKVTYAMLEEFENDLHRHIHLENNILFPKAIELEKKIQTAS